MSVFESFCFIKNVPYCNTTIQILKVSYILWCHIAVNKVRALHIRVSYKNCIMLFCNLTMLWCRSKDMSLVLKTIG